MLSDCDGRVRSWCIGRACSVAVQKATQASIRHLRSAKAALRLTYTGGMVLSLTCRRCIGSFHVGLAAISVRLRRSSRVEGSSVFYHDLRRVDLMFKAV